MTDYALEPYEAVVNDIKPLLPDHHRELALYQDEIPLEPDFSQYERACSSGLMRIYTARQDGRLIGYAIFALTPRHSHYKHRWAINDIFWIDPKHRSVGNGNGLCDFFEEDLRRDGPVVIHVETKIGAPALAVLLGMRGYQIVGPSFSKRLV